MLARVGFENLKDMKGLPQEKNPNQRQSVRKTDLPPAAHDPGDAGKKEHGAERENDRGSVPGRRGGAGHAP